MTTKNEHGLEVTECKSCRARMFFAPSEKGKQIPLQAAPSGNGNIMIRKGTAVYKSKTNVPEPHEKLYTSHFADCPNAQQYRSKKE